MAFKNPSIIQNGISNEEFENLENRIKKIEDEMQNIKESIHGSKRTETNGYSIISKDISNAILAGKPRITSININNNPINDIENLKRSSNEDTDEIFSAYNPSEKIVSIDDILRDNKPYKIWDQSKIPERVHVNSGMQRTLVISKNHGANKFVA